jgi:hypothetical protein
MDRGPVGWTCVVCLKGPLGDNPETVSLLLVAAVLRGRGESVHYVY